MSLAQLLYPPPTPQGLGDFMFSHNQHHIAIIRGLKQVKNVDATLYQIYPFNPKDLENWLQAHQQLHSDYESVLQIQGNDLSEVDFKNQKQFDAWLFLNFSSHRSAAQLLGVDYL